MKFKLTLTFLSCENILKPTEILNFMTKMSRIFLIKHELHFVNVQCSYIYDENNKFSQNLNTFFYLSL